MHPVHESRRNSQGRGVTAMKNIPLYDVRKINDLGDMIRQSVNLFGDKPAFLVKDPRAAGLGIMTS